MPREHGSWAIALAPAFAGAWLARRISAAGFLLLAVALLAFLALEAASLWWRSRRRRYRAPALAYGGAAGTALATLLVARPALLAWWPAFVPLAALVVALTVGGHSAAPATRLAGIATAALACAPAYDLGTGLQRSGAWPLQPGWGRAWAVTALLLAYFAACLPHVHALLRARRSTGWWAASAVANLSGLALAAVLAMARLASPWHAVVWVLLAARAVGMPAAARRHDRPWPVAAIGGVEFGAAALVLVSALLTP